MVNMWSFCKFIYVFLSEPMFKMLNLPIPIWMIGQLFNTNLTMKTLLWCSEYFCADISILFQILYRWSQKRNLFELMNCWRMDFIDRSGKIHWFMTYQRICWDIFLPVLDINVVRKDKDAFWQNLQNRNSKWP